MEPNQSKPPKTLQDVLQQKQEYNRKKWQDTLDKKEAEHAKIEEELRIRIRELEQIQAEKDEQYQRITSEQIEELARLEDKSEERRLTIETMHEMVAEFKQELEEKTDHTMHLESENIELRRDLRRKEQLEDNLAARLEDTIRTIPISMLTAKELEIHSLKRRVEELEASSLTLAKEVDDKTQLILKLTTQFEEYMSTNSRKCSDLEEDNGRLETRLEQSQTHIEKLTDEFDKEKERMFELEMKMSGLVMRLGLNGIQIDESGEVLAPAGSSETSGIGLKVRNAPSSAPEPLESENGRIHSILAPGSSELSGSSRIGQSGSGSSILAQNAQHGLESTPGAFRSSELAPASSEPSGSSRIGQSGSGPSSLAQNAQNGSKSSPGAFGSSELALGASNLAQNAQNAPKLISGPSRRSNLAENRPGASGTGSKAQNAPKLISGPSLSSKLTENSGNAPEPAPKALRPPGTHTITTRLGPGPSGSSGTGSGSPGSSEPSTSSPGPSDPSISKNARKKARKAAKKALNASIAALNELSSSSRDAPRAPEGFRPPSDAPKAPKPVAEGFKRLSHITIAESTESVLQTRYPVQAHDYSPLLVPIEYFGTFGPFQAGQMVNMDAIALQLLAAGHGPEQAGLAPPLDQKAQAALLQTYLGQSMLFGPGQAGSSVKQGPDISGSEPKPILAQNDGLEVSNAQDYASMIQNLRAHPQGPPGTVPYLDLLVQNLKNADPSAETGPEGLGPNTDQTDWAEDGKRYLKLLAKVSHCAPGPSGCSATPAPPGTHTITTYRTQNAPGSSSLAPGPPEPPDSILGVPDASKPILRSQIAPGPSTEPTASGSTTPIPDYMLEFMKYLESNPDIMMPAAGHDGLQLRDLAPNGSGGSA